jgi:hypothetical protein
MSTVTYTLTFEAEEVNPFTVENSAKAALNGAILYWGTYSEDPISIGLSDENRLILKVFTPIESP